MVGYIDDFGEIRPSNLIDEALAPFRTIPRAPTHIPKDSGIDRRQRDRFHRPTRRVPGTNRQIPPHHSAPAWKGGEIGGAR